MNKNTPFTYFLIIAFSTGVLNLAAQKNNQAEVKAKVDSFFVAMSAGDSSWMDQNLLPDAALITIGQDGEKNETLNRKAFIKVIASFNGKKLKIDERLLNYNIRVDANLAVVESDYSIYVNDHFVHCGLDVFCLNNTAGRWRILSIYDTRRKEACNIDPVTDINTLMDNWHKAAATANEDVFFGSMSKDGIYIGTDATERWTREELRGWSKKYFDKDTAWDFKPIERKVYLSDDGQYAWFNETLNTWMGVCRASGTLSKESDGWKINQYHLSVTIDNDKINGFIDLVGAPGRKK
ncbi:MAG TPA: nuclear transport factor 2 family protein [Saprospiraceae bacterium]|nr:nuclear transport factor 2 family protein [Saprospiraceae bacterium]